MENVTEYSLTIRMLDKCPIVRDPRNEPVQIRTPEQTYEICKDIAALPTEVMACLLVDGKNNLIDKYLVTIGLVDASLVHPREVFRRAIVMNCSAIVMVHNHPSGDCTPSMEDIRVTRQLVEAGKIIDIKVADHVIVSSPKSAMQKSFASLRELGVIEFT